MAEPIRVAQMMTDMNYGGVEMVVMNYYRHIDRTKVQFDFFALEGSAIPQREEIEQLGGRVYIVPKYTHLLAYEKEIIRLFKQNQYKIVHSHMNTLSVFPLFAAWMCRIPVRVAHNHSVPSGKEKKRDALKYFLRAFAKFFPTHYFACSEKAGRWMWGDRCYDQGKVFVLNNAIDFRRFLKQDKEAQKLKKSLNLDGKLVIAHIGRFTSAKNHKFLIQVFKEIISINENAVLLLVGDGELHNDISRWVEDAGLTQNVVFVGQVSNPEKYYQVADVVTLPSIFEGLPLTVIESQVAGVPVVVSTVVPEEAIISDGCVRLELSDPNWANQILAMAGKTVVLDKRSENYNIKYAVKKLENWYEDRVKECQTFQ